MLCNSFNWLYLRKRHNVLKAVFIEEPEYFSQWLETVGYLNMPHFFVCCPAYNKNKYPRFWSWYSWWNRKIILLLPMLKYMQCNNISASADFRSGGSPYISGITHHFSSITTRMLWCIWQDFTLMLLKPVLWLQQEKPVFNVNAAS